MVVLGVVLVVIGATLLVAEAHVPAGALGAAGGVGGFGGFGGFGAPGGPCPSSGGVVMRSLPPGSAVTLLIHDTDAASIVRNGAAVGYCVPLDTLARGHTLLP